MSFTINWSNRKAVLDYLASFAAPPSTKLLMEAVGCAAIRVQERMRQQLESMIYSQPTSSSGYERTRALFRSTHAARPSNDHSGDTDRARGGTDLVASSPMQVVERRGDTIASDVGSWADYAEDVHEGRGRGERTARPFVSSVEQDANDILNEEVTRALQRMASRK